jgi:hypothetical protein
MREMQNAELRMQNCGIFYENDLKKSAKPTPSFCILHSSFCIGRPLPPDKCQFDNPTVLRYNNPDSKAKEFFMSNTVLYALWGGLYALCAGLGFVTGPGEGLQFLMTVLSLALFVPPFLLNYRAAKAGNRRTLELVRNLSLGWLVVTSLLLVGNFLTVFASEWVGNLLYSLLIIACSPLVCSGSWALAIFCWACVFFDARSKLKK